MPPRALTFLAFLLALAAPLARAESLTADDIDLQAIFRDNPNQIPSGLASSTPIPVIYADFLGAVTARVDKTALAEFKTALLADLPPFIDVNDPVPENKTLGGLLQQNKKRAIALIVIALTKFPDHSKWTILRACGALDAAELDEPLETVALTDTNATNRAFAFKAIAQRKQKNAAALLQEGLFDPQLSIRLLCMELLSEAGENIGSVTAVMPCRPRHAFQFLFLETALKRVMPTIDAPTFFKQPFSIRYGAFTGAAPEVTKSFVALAEKRADRPYAAMVLYLCGDEVASAKALDTLVKVMLENGKKPADHRSPEFQIQSDLVDVFQQSTPAQFKAIQKIFKTNLREFSEEREALLTTLAYAQSVSDAPDLADDLLRVRDMQTRNKDLLLGAALALAHHKSPQAIPSLIQILSMRSDAYTVVAIQTLEKLTGIETPGVPRPDPKTGQYDPKAAWNVQGAYDFWRKWIQNMDHDLQFDAESQHVK